MTQKQAQQPHKTPPEYLAIGQLLRDAGHELSIYHHYIYLISIERYCLHLTGEGTILIQLEDADGELHKIQENNVAAFELSDPNLITNITSAIITADYRNSSSNPRAIRRYLKHKLKNLPPRDENRRIAGDALCPDCEHKAIDHPLEESILSYDDQPYLHKLCSGEVVKL